MRPYGVLAKRGREDRANFVSLGEEDLELLDLLLLSHRDDPLAQLFVGLENHLSGGRVDHISGGKPAVELGHGQWHPFETCLLHRLECRLADLLPGPHLVAAVDLDFLFDAPPKQVRPDGPLRLGFTQRDPADGVEAANDLVGAAQAERPEEHAGQELPFPVDPDIQQVLGVVFELHPGSAIRDDLGYEQLTVLGVEERARRSMELRDDDALGPVDDEGPVVGHQWDITEVDFLLLDVPDRLDPGLGVLIPDDETDGHLQRHGIGHAALLTLFDVVLELQADSVLADLAHHPTSAVGGAALGAEHLVLTVGISLESMTTGRARLAQLVQAGQTAALTLPVPNRVIDELERRVLSEVTNRKHRLEHRLQTSIVAFGRQPGHLQEALVGLLLNLDQIGDGNRRPDL